MYEQQGVGVGIGDEYLTPPPEKRDAETEIGIIKELSPAKIIEQIRMQLKGFEYDYLEDKWIKIAEPMMNEKGIKYFIWSVRSAGVTDITTFSNYAPDEISKRVEFVVCQAIPIMYLWHKEFGIEKQSLPIITSFLFTLSESSFKKSQNAGDRSVIGRTIQEQIMNRSQFANMGFQPQERPSLLQSLNPFHKKK